MHRRCLLAALILAAQHGVACASPPDGDAALAEAIMARLAALPDRDASFVETKRLVSVASALQSRGQLVFRHPAHLEKITAAPRAERLVIDGGTLTITEPGVPARTLALGSHPALQAMATAIGATLAGDLRALQGIYDVNASGSMAAWHIVLRPRSPALARFVNSVTLDGNSADLHGFAITQTNGDSQVLAIQPGA